MLLLLCFLGVSSSPRLVLINVLLTLARGIECVVLVLCMENGRSEILLWYHAAASYAEKSRSCRHTSVSIRMSMLCQRRDFSVQFVQSTPI